MKLKFTVLSRHLKGVPRNVWLPWETLHGESKQAQQHCNWVNRVWSFGWNMGWHRAQSAGDVYKQSEAGLKNHWNWTCIEEWKIQMECWKTTAGGGQTAEVQGQAANPLQSQNIPEEYVCIHQWGLLQQTAYEESGTAPCYEGGQGTGWIHCHQLW